MNAAAPIPLILSLLKRSQFISGPISIEILIYLNYTALKNLQQFYHLLKDIGYLCCHFKNIQN